MAASEVFSDEFRVRAGESLGGFKDQLAGERREGRIVRQLRLDSPPPPSESLSHWDEAVQALVRENHADLPEHLGGARAGSAIREVLGTFDGGPEPDRLPEVGDHIGMK